MSFELDIFNTELSADYLEWLVDEHSIDIQKHFSKLWEYYANQTYKISSLGTSDRKVSESGKCYVQAQEYGLPTRITGLVHNGSLGLLGARVVKDIQRKEVVIENDLAWRINAVVDFLFGKPTSFVSRSPDRFRQKQHQNPGGKCHQL